MLRYLFQLRRNASHLSDFGGPDMGFGNSYGYHTGPIIHRPRGSDLSVLDPGVLDPAVSETHSEGRP